MDAVAHYDTAPAREVIRDRNGVVAGALERQRHTGKLIARAKDGRLAGIYDPRSGETRDEHGRLIGRSNLLPVLLFSRR